MLMIDPPAHRPHPRHHCAHSREQPVLVDRDGALIRVVGQLGGQPLTLGAIVVPDDDFCALLDEQPGMRRAPIIPHP
jgi:hypothetical protein